MATRKILYTKWGTIALLTTIVLAANIFAVVTTQIGSSPLKPAISSVFASIALQSLHIYVLDFEHQKVPHVRWVLIVALFLACSAHVSFITLFAVLRKDLFYNLSKLLCIFHAIFAESITRIWSLIRKTWPSISVTIFAYVMIATQLAFFAVGTWQLVSRNFQLVWTLPAITLWEFSVPVAFCFLALIREHMASDDSSHKIWTRTFTLTFVTLCVATTTAIASTVLGILGTLYDWQWLFLAEFALLQSMYAFSAPSWFYKEYRNLKSEQEIQRGAHRSSSSESVDLGMVAHESELGRTGSRIGIADSTVANGSPGFEYSETNVAVDDTEKPEAPKHQLDE